MTAREVALWVITGLSVAGPLLLALAPRAARYGGGCGALFLSAGFTLAAYAALGWVWFWTEGTVR